MYEFASGVINIWEKRLLSRNDQERMLTAPDKASAFLVLFDTDLGELAAGTEEIEKIFEKDLAALKTKLDSILDDQGKLVNYLFLVFEVWNLKIALKALLLKVQTQSMEPFSCTLVSFQRLAKRVGQVWQKDQPVEDLLAERLTEGGGYLERIMLSAQTELNQMEAVDSAAIETAVDKAYFQIKAEFAQNLSSFLAELVRLEIDVANIKSAACQNSHGWLISGGNLKTPEIQKLLAHQGGETPEQNLTKFLEILNLSFLIEDFLKHKSDVFLEQGLQKFLSHRVLEKARSTACGLEKVLAFFYRKMNSHFNIRLILFAKDNNLDTTEIEKLLLPI
jgi:vacuolar-type H+-ATPase subunit C/Vma6